MSIFGHLVVLPLRQGGQTARERKNETSQCTKQAKKKVKQENDLPTGS